MKQPAPLSDIPPWQLAAIGFFLVACLGLIATWPPLAAPAPARRDRAVLGLRYRRLEAGRAAADPLLFPELSEGIQRERLLLISRFLVKPGQYAELMGELPPLYPVKGESAVSPAPRAPGPADTPPLTGLSPAAAAAFCRRLSAVTGAQIRLPQPEELAYALAREPGLRPGDRFPAEFVQLTAANGGGGFGIVGRPGQPALSPLADPGQPVAGAGFRVVRVLERAASDQGEGDEPE